MQEVLVNWLGGLSLPRKSVVRLTDCPDMTIDVYRGRKTITQQQQQNPTKGLWPRGQRSKPYIQGVSKKMWTYFENTITPSCMEEIFFVSACSKLNLLC